jgi:hypothetical protein
MEVKMKKSELNRFLPFEEDYNLLNKYRKYGRWLMITIFGCSIIIPILKTYLLRDNINFFFDLLSGFYIVLIVVYYILNTYTETFLYPATARKRRKGFIDNSLGSKFLTKKLEGYYTNDNINYGPYKMLVNCCENCFFTMNIAKEMRSQIVIKNLIALVIILLIANWGMKNNMVALPVLQVFFSSLFFAELVHHFNFIAKLEQIFEKFIEDIDIRLDDEQMLQKAILLFLDYETTLAYNKAPLSDAVYEKVNEKLSIEWEEMKKRYDISK